MDVRRRARWLVVAAGMVMAWATPGIGVRSGAAADLRPSWQCLPGETAVMVHAPEPKVFLETIRSRTRFGALVLEPQRLLAAWNIAADSLPEADGEKPLAAFEKSLAKYGLSPADVDAAFAGDMGYGIVSQPRPEGLRPLSMLLAWIEPGAESATRMMAAYQQRLGEEADEAATEGQPAVKRIDLEMAGHEVIWAVHPVMQLDLGDVKLEGRPDAERMRRIRQELAERAKTAKRIQVGQTHAFLMRIDGRLLYGMTLASGGAVGMNVALDDGQLKINAGATANRSAAAAGDRDFDRESGTDEARGVFERFVTAHTEAGTSPLAGILQTPGMQSALPAGTTLVDVVVDPRVLLKAFPPSAGPERATMDLAGLDDVGPLAWRLSFDGGWLRQGMYLSLPAPRRGLMRILEQDCDAAEVPSFVTAEAVELTQISLDLGKAYATVREVMVGHGGEETGNMFTAAEMQTQGWLGFDLPTVLTALGSRHAIVSYPPQVSAALAEARKTRAADGTLGTMPAADRLAVVWQLADEQPFVKILQRLATLSGTDVTEEQGFRGVRLPGGNAAAFVGRNHAVLAVGADAAEKTLAAIRNPPAGPAAFRESEAVRRAVGMLPPAPARLFSVGDASRTGGVLGMLREFAAALEPGDVTAEYRELLPKLQPLLPSAGDMEGMFGGAAASLQVDDQGIAWRSGWELPAP